MVQDIRLLLQFLQWNSRNGTIAVVAEALRDFHRISLEHYRHKEEVLHVLLKLGVGSSRSLHTCVHKESAGYCAADFAEGAGVWTTAVHVT